MDQTIIFDISSDEELGFDDSSTADNFDWIRKLLESDDDGDCGGGGDDSDDVFLVREVFPKKKRVKTSLPSHNDDDDDDCVVLDCDPDKSAPNAKESISGGDSDDLLIVGEKGQVACRDYPHSRHLCAKFSFSSTPHESYCDLCHCYVCDSLAPCAYWGSGISTTDHCHATDKEQYWQLERKKVRQLKIVPTTKPNAASPAKLSRTQQTSAQPVLAPRPVSTCGISSSFGVPNITSQARTVARNRFEPHLVSQQLLRTCNSNTQIDRSSRSSPSFVPSRPSLTTFSSTLGAVPAVVPNRSLAYLPQMVSHQVAVNPIQNSPFNSLQPNASWSATLPLQIAPAPTSNFHGYGPPSTLTSGCPNFYSYGNRTQNFTRSVLPRDANSLGSVTPSSQVSAISHDISGPFIPCSSSNALSGITQTSQQPSTARQKFPIYPRDTANAMNSVVAQSCQRAQVPVDECLSSVEHNLQPPSGCGNFTSLDFALDKWLEDDQSVLGALEGSYFFDPDNLPHISVPVDPGLLYFDLETSMKGLTQS